MGSNEWITGWRSRLYEAYVTSGQARVDTDDPDEAFASRAPWIRTMTERHLPVDREAEILDLGCGHGAFVYVLREMGFSNVTGVDVSLEQVQVAERLGISGVKQGEAADHVAARDSSSVDVVLAIDLLEHLPRSELLSLAQDVYRILRRGGRWVFHVPNAEGLFGPGVRYGDLTHEISFTPSSIWQLCRAVGFDHVEVHSDPPVVHGAVSLGRRLLWTLGVLPLRLLFAAESGGTAPVLTRSLLAVAYR